MIFAIGMIIGLLLGSMIFGLTAYQRGYRDGIEAVKRWIRFDQVHY